MLRNFWSSVCSLLTRWFLQSYGFVTDTDKIIAAAAKQWEVFLRCFHAIYIICKKSGVKVDMRISLFNGNNQLCYTYYESDTYIQPEQLKACPSWEYLQRADNLCYILQIWSAAYHERMYLIFSTSSILRSSLDGSAVWNDTWDRCTRRQD